MVDGLRSYCIMLLWTKFDNKLDRNLKTTILLDIFLLDVNLDKFTSGLHFLLISFIFVKLKKIVMLLIKCLNFEIL